MLVTKNSTAPSAINPGKKMYMASLNPIASPTCSKMIPRVPAMMFMTKRKNEVLIPRVF